MKTFPSLTNSKVKHHQLSSKIGGLRQEISEAQRDVCVLQDPEQSDDVIADLLGFSIELINTVGHLKVWNIIMNRGLKTSILDGPMTIYVVHDRIKAMNDGEREDAKVMLDTGFFDVLKKDWEKPYAD